MFFRYEHNRNILFILPEKLLAHTVNKSQAIKALPGRQLSIGRLRSKAAPIGK